MTHNRSELLPQTLDSMIVQSARPNRITVLDNESIDDTEEVVKKYRKNNIFYEKTYGQYGNFFKAQEIMKSSDAEYVMLFHDDNLLHPEFFEKMLLALNSMDEAPLLLMSAYNWFPVNKMEVNLPIERIIKLPDTYLYPSPLDNNYILINNAKEMVNLLLTSENPPWPQINPCICSSLYRKDVFLERVPLNDIYGRIDDGPLMIRIASKGKVVILADRNAVFHRTHRLRESYSIETANTLEQSMNWVREFTKYIDEEDREAYRKLVFMISCLYPFISRPDTLKEYPPKCFIEKLVSDGLAPDYVKEFECPSLYRPPEKPVNFYDVETAIKLYSSQLQPLQPLPQPTNKKLSFWERIFSVRNEWRSNGKKRKVLRLLGLKVCLGVKRVKEKNKPATVPAGPFINKVPSFWEKIFSVRNEWRSNGKKRKVLRLLGLKVCLGVTRIQNNTIPKTLQNDMISTYDALMVSDIAKNNTIDIQRENFDHVHLSISSVGNTVVIEKNPSIGQIHIKITGKNHSIRLGDLSSVIGTLNIQADGVDTTTNIGNVYVGSYLNILNGKKIKDQSSRNTQIYIGNGSSFEGCQICSFHTGTSVSIGEKCMFSRGIYVMGSDTHPIYDYETKKIINKAYHGVTIGNHCWIGSGATILKNAVIPDDCIIGWNAVVTKSFDEPHCAIAGNPAKIVKHGVTWDFEDENLFI